MNPVFPAQKRAEEFSAMVEDASAAQLRDTGKHADLVPLVGLVTSLRSQPAPEARPEFVAGLRERLMLAAETALVPDTAAQVVARQPAPRRTRRERRVAAAIGGFAIVSASASMSVAAQSALPGDTLYPLKRAIENIHEKVSQGADDKGTTMLDNASSRLDEVDELSRSGAQDPQVIAETLEEFSAQAVEASDVLLGDFEQTGRLSSIAELRDFTASSIDALERLESLVPVEVRAVLIQAREVLDEIDRQATSLCPACSDLPALTSSDVTAAADRGPIYDLVEKVVTPAPPASPTEGKGKGAGPEQGKTATKPTKPASQEPAPEPTAPTPTAPSGDDKPSVLPPESTGSEDPQPPRTGLGTVVGGVGTVDVPEVVDGLTETLDDVLDGTLGGAVDQP